VNLISESYREQNRQLHATGSYGISGHKYATQIKYLSENLMTVDILDYGCRQRTLEQTLGFPIKNYDPAIKGFDTPPEPADIVSCTDVLEHIEPEYLDLVLDDLKRVTKRGIYFIIDLVPAKKTLPDGRNAHLILESGNWWITKLLSRFTARSITVTKKRVYATMGPL